MLKCVKKCESDLNGLAKCIKECMPVKEACEEKEKLKK